MTHESTRKDLTPFYLRRSSGEELSKKSLETSLIKHIRRSFRNIRNAELGPTLCIFTPPGKIVEGTALQILLSPIEERFGRTVLSFFPNCFRESSINSLQHSLRKKIHELHLYNDRLKPATIFELIKYSIYMGKELCKTLSFKPPIVLPFTLTDIVEGFIEFLIFNYNPKDLEVFNALIHHSSFLLPFKEVTRSDILAFAYKEGVVGLLNICPLELGRGVRHISEAVAELEVKHCELIYSTLRSIKQLVEIREELINSSRQ